MAAARLLAPFDLGEGREDEGGFHAAAVAQVAATAQEAAAKWGGRGRGKRRCQPFACAQEEASIAKKRPPSKTFAEIKARCRSAW